MAIRWQRGSGEAEALQRQAHALARLRLNEVLAEGGNGTPAYVTDLDEIMLDSSALIARDLETCHDFPGCDTWNDWERPRNPTLIPGAKAFLDHDGSSKGERRAIIEADHPSSC